MKDTRQKTLILSIFFSSLGPIVLLYAVFSNTSTTQLADFLRRTVELTVLIVALWMYKKMQKIHDNPEKIRDYKQWMYRISGAVLMLSAVILLIILIYNVVNLNAPTGNVTIGLSIAVLGLVFNGYFAIRYRHFNRVSRNAVMDTQSKIYQAKMIVDINVIIALSSIILFTNTNLILMIDRIGTMMIVVYLFYRGFRILRYREMPLK